MDEVARIIRSGDGQSVELPEGYRFEGTEVRVRRDGDRVILEPANLEIDEDTGLSLNDMRAMIAEGEDESGDAELDMQGIIREARVRFDAERR